MIWYMCHIDKEMADKRDTDNTSRKEKKASSL